VDDIACGTGTGDNVVADTADVVAGDCEQVDRPATQTAPAGGNSPQSNVPQGTQPPGQSATTPPDTTPPAVVLKIAAQRLKTVIAKGLRVGTSFSEPAILTAKLTLAAPLAKQLKLGRKAVVIASLRNRQVTATTRTVVLKLSSAARKRLRGAKKPVSATLSIEARDASGNVGKATSRVKLKP
jgi:hypothetical protein